MTRGELSCGEHSYGEYLNIPSFRIFIILKIGHSEAKKVE